MKILQIHKFHTKHRGGGSVTSYFETAKFLKKEGHEVIFFSMKDITNEKTKYEKYFIEGFDLSKDMSFWEKIKLLPKTIYNREAVKNIEELIKKERPDIAHAHNIEHYLTPAIFKVLSRYKIPIVMTLHNYHLICPNYKLFIRGKICEKCKNNKYYNCFLNRCVKESWMASAVAMVDAYFNKFFGFYNYVNTFIVPSHFMKNKCIEFGIESSRIKVVRNSFSAESLDSSEMDEEGDYFLYYGRLSEEKGIENVIKAVGILKKNKKLNGKKFFIVGKGPEETKLRACVTKDELSQEIIFKGFKIGEELDNIVKKSMFVIVPSIWYENAPFVVVESHFLGKPVIISSLGGTKELIDEGNSGLVYEANNVNDLVEKITTLLNKNAEERRRMGEFGKIKANKLMSDSKKLLKIYDSLTDLKK